MLSMASVHSGRDGSGENLKCLDVVTKDPVTGITVIVHFSVYVPLPVLHATVEVQNTATSNEDITIRQLSSLVLGCLTLPSEEWWEEWRLHFAHNAWFREAQWQNRSLPEVDLDYFGVSNSSRSNFAVSNQGLFSKLGHLPMGALCHSDGSASYLWQIEHSGSWRWEIGDYREGIYLNACGPADQDHSWSRALGPGESFISVLVSLVVVASDFETLFTPLTQYRRRMRRQHRDNQKLPIIFNDYINYLIGDPTTTKVVALIKPAAEAEAQYFCIDCG